MLLHGLGNQTLLGSLLEKKKKKKKRENLSRNLTYAYYDKKIAETKIERKKKKQYNLITRRTKNNKSLQKKYSR